MTQKRSDTILLTGFAKRDHLQIIPTPPQQLSQSVHSNDCQRHQNHQNLGGYFLNSVTDKAITNVRKVQ